MTEEEAQYAFRSALIQLLPEVGCTVSWADQDNRTNIQKPYYSLSVSPSRAIGGDEHSSVDANGILTVTGSRELNVTITRIGQKGEHPLHVISAVRDAMRKPSFGWAMQRAGISLAMAYQCLNVSKQIQVGEIEPRGVLECVIRYHSSVVDDVGVIDIVQMSGEISAPARSFIAMKKEVK